MTVKHSSNYKWAFVQSATDLLTTHNLTSNNATLEGTVDLSGGHDWSAAAQDFKLNGRTISLTTNCADLAAVNTAIDAAITAAGFTDFTISVETIVHSVISSPLSFELEAGTSDALVTIGWAAGIYTGAAFDAENGVTNLPFYTYNKERVYGAAGMVLTPIKSKDHKDCSFPMFFQTDTFIDAAAADQEGINATPTLFQVPWTDGSKIYNAQDGYISEYKLEGANEDYPTQTVSFQFKDINEIASILNFPYRTEIPPQDMSEFSIELDGTEITDIVSFSVTLNPGISGNPVATTFVRSPESVNKKDRTIVITTRDSSAAMLALYDSVLSATETTYQVEIICGLGTLKDTIMIVSDVKRAEISNEPGNYEYEVTLTNTTEDECTWTAA